MPKADEGVSNLTFNNMTRSDFIIKTIISITLLTLITYFISTLYLFYTLPIIPSNISINYILPPHASLKQFTNDLQQNTHLTHPIYFKSYAYLTGEAFRLHSGEYLFKGGSTAPQILKQVASHNVIIREITFVEGCTIWQMLNALNQAPRLNHELKNAPLNKIMQQLNLGNQNPEGQFFPNTYFYTYGSSDKSILIHAYHLMQQHLQNQWQQRAANLPYLTSYDALIAASIIEKEAKLNVERPIIAGVIVRRLQQKMFLDMDATIIYGLGENYIGPLTKDDMRKDTPYNSYLHLGFPPTPIAMPSLASINAALHPQAGDVMYYVAKNDGSGSHQFSVTYQEQQQAIAKYEGIK